jgi:hypothetical protein
MRGVFGALSQQKHTSPLLSEASSMYVVRTSRVPTGQSSCVQQGHSFVPREKAPRHMRGLCPRTPGIYEPDDAVLVSGSLFGLVKRLDSARVDYRWAGKPYDGPGDTIIVRAPYAAPFFLLLRFQAGSRAGARPRAPVISTRSSELRRLGYSQAPSPGRR